jgi:N-acyl-D-aspartate/D-glutamate deacylase
MALDLVVKNGTLVDGTGADRRRADVAVHKGRIVDVGTVSGAARETIDADGLIVAPGFVDPHTHYDAQISWDSMLNSSSEHGVTTVVMGNCGVGVAPCRGSDHDLVIQDLINVEGMSQAVLREGIRWDWETFPDYLAMAGRGACAVNRAFLVPLSPLRTYVMGPEASERGATAEETRAIAEHIRAAMDAGASGFSSSNNRSQIGYQGRPFAARLTSRDEYAAYCDVLRQAGRGVVQIAATNRFATLADDEYELLDFLLTRSGRKVTWISLLNDPNKPNGCREVLDKADPLLRRGSAPQMLLRPMLREFTLQKPYPFMEIAAAGPVFNRPLEEQKRFYTDPAFRAAAKAELREGRRFSGQPPKTIVCKVGNLALRGYEMRTVGEIAAERNADPFDTLLDIALEDNLETLYAYERGNSDRRQIADMLRDPRTMIGLSDGGAHVDMLYEAGYPTFLLSHWVREQQVLTLEHAVKRITSEPADFFGFADRGRIAPGKAADIVIFDERTIGSPERGAFIYDLPTGAGRLHAKAQGIARVLVNGRTLYRDGLPTGELPGVIVSAR